MILYILAYKYTFLLGIWSEIEVQVKVEAAKQFSKVIVLSNQQDVRFLFVFYIFC